MRGAIWAGSALIAQKVAGLASQLALGWLLSEKDFAAYAIAITLAGIVGVVRDGGAQKVLIQGGDDYARLARSVFALSAACNALAAFFLVVPARWVASATGTPDLVPMAWVLAISLLLSSPLMLRRARLTIDLRFGTLARISMVSSLLRCGTMVSLAALGLGPLSFVWPLVVVALYEWAAMVRAVAALPPMAASAPLSRHVVSQVLASSKWVIFSGLASTLINQGDYLAIAGLRGDLLGVYFFGYQLAASFGGLFAVAIPSVILPTLARLVGDPARFRAGYLSTVGTLAVVISPLCCAAALAIPLVVKLLWAGKWGAAIPVAQITALGLIFRMQTPLAITALESLGRWRLCAALLTVDGIGTVAAAALGCWLGSPAGIAFCVTGHHVLMAFVQSFATARASSVPPAAVIRQMVPSVNLSFLAAGGTLSMLWLLAPVSPWGQIVVGATSFSLLLLLGWRTVLPARGRADLLRIRSQIVCMAGWG